MKKVLILSSIWGHESIAKGIRDALKGSGYETRLEVIRIDPISETSYKAFYRFLPKLFKTAFKLGRYKFVGRVVDKYTKISYFKLIENTIRDYHPDIVICSYLAFISSLEILKKKYRFQYFNFISDPWSITRIHFSKKGTNLIFDKHSMAEAKKFKFDHLSYETGWFTENKYYNKMTKSQACKTLGIDPTILTLCVTGGSEGTYDILKIINSFVKIKKHVQILFMCGKNKQLYDMAKGFSKLLGTRSRIKIYPYKFTSRMNIYMSASDLVIGKAGPNTIFESVACGVPFFAISHISGQEDGNLDLIRKYKVGFAEENPLKIAKILKSVIADPSILNRFEDPIQTLTKYNKDSRQKLLSLLNK